MPKVKQARKNSNAVRTITDGNLKIELVIPPAHFKKASSMKVTDTSLNPNGANWVTFTGKELKALKKALSNI